MKRVSNDVDPTRPDPKGRVGGGARYATASAGAPAVAPLAWPGPTGSVYYDDYEEYERRWRELDSAIPKSEYDRYGFEVCGVCGGHRKVDFDNDVIDEPGWVAVMATEAPGVPAMEIMGHAKCVEGDPRFEAVD